MSVLEGARAEGRMENLRGRARGREGGEGKAVEREGELDRRREEVRRGEEWGISENRGTSQWCRVSHSDFCLFQIGFLFSVQSPTAKECEAKAREAEGRRERWADNERDLCIFLFSSGRHEK